MSSASNPGNCIKDRDYINDVLMITKTHEKFDTVESSPPSPPSQRQVGHLRKTKSTQIEHSK
jgi:hypothetical protein